MHLGTHARARTHTHTLTHTHSHTYTHTLTQALSLTHTNTQFFFFFKKGMQTVKEGTKQTKSLLCVLPNCDTKQKGDLSPGLVCEGT